MEVLQLELSKIRTLDIPLQVHVLYLGSAPRSREESWLSCNDSREFFSEAAGHTEELWVFLAHKLAE